MKKLLLFCAVFAAGCGQDNTSRNAAGEPVGKAPLCYRAYAVNEGPGYNKRVDKVLGDLDMVKEFVADLSTATLTEFGVTGYHQEFMCHR